MVIADSGNYRVRVVAAQTGTFYGQAMKAGDVYGIAGNGKRSRPALGPAPPGPRSSRRAWPWMPRATC